MAESCEKFTKRKKKNQFLRNPHQPGYWRTNLWRHIDKENLHGYGQLCKICQNIVQRLPSLPTMALGPDTYDYYAFEPLHGLHLEHYATLGMLQQSARDGCHLCSLLASPGYEDFDRAETDPYELEFDVPQDQCTARLSVKLVDGSIWSTDLQLEMWNERPPAFYCQTLQCSRTDDIQVLDLAKEWMQTCLTKHKTCTNSGTLGRRQRRAELSDLNIGYLPRRLIRVDFANNTVSSSRLVARSALDPDSSYLTLSHCWGGADVLKLTQRTLRSLTTNIPLDQLPKSFSDAFFVTGYLGFKYIWIDSLCIMQDSVEDWRIESEQMGNIYWHSECTIAAAKARNSHGGLFSERHPLSFVPYKLPAFVSKPDSTSGESNSYRWSASNRRTELGPLYTRAWVVQERALARRTLHFAEDTIYWECLKMSASERGKFSGGLLKAERDRILNGDKRFPFHDTRTWLSDWWSILQAYSRCNLTYTADRFRAIEGLAILVQKTKNTSMIHGLWQSSLITELLWRTKQPCSIGRLLNAPSWSWISMRGEIFNSFAEFHHDSSIKATATVVHQDDLSPNANSAQTLLITAHILPINWTEPIQISDRSKKVYPFHFRNGGTIPTAHQQKAWHWFWTPDIQPEKDWELWALQIIEDRVILPGFGPSRQGVGLIIMPVNENGVVFRRVGYYSIIWDIMLDDHGESHRFDYLDGTIQPDFGTLRTVQLI